MICTVTFNPSLDYIVSVDDFQLGMTNRTSSELILPGGKGINVSIVLKNLGLDSTALGYVAGFTGEELIRRLTDFGVNADFIKINHGMTRINLKLKSIDGTEINGCGPDIDAEALEQLMEKIDRLQEGDVLVLAGSIPYSMPRHLRCNGSEESFLYDLRLVFAAGYDQYFLRLHNGLDPHGVCLLRNILRRCEESLVGFDRRLCQVHAMYLLVKTLSRFVEADVPIMSNSQKLQVHAAQ